MELTHLSYSSISTFLSCGEAWKRKYVLNEPTYATPELVFGTAVHSTVEKHIGQGASLLDTWGSEWNKATEGKEIMWGADTPEQHYNEGVRILGNEQVAYNLACLKALMDSNGAAIERKVELKVPGVPIPVIGYIDLIAEDGVPGDIKTSAKSWSQDRAQGELQSLFYLAALNQAGRPTPEWKFRHYTIIKTKTPKFEMFEHTHNAGELMFLFDLIQRVWGAISAQVFTLNPTGWRCSANYCDYFSKCRGKYAR